MARTPSGPARPPLRWILGIAALTLLVGGAGGLVPSAQAATIVVTTTADQLDDAPPCSLREAIISANRDEAIGGCTAGSGPDLIVLGAGEYLVRISPFDLFLEEEDEVGDLDILSEITIVGLGPGLTIVDGAWRFDADSDRIFHVGPEITPRQGALLQQPTLVLEGLTVQDGEPHFGLAMDTPVAFTNDGGGILVQTGTSLVARNVVIDHNAADTGAGGGLAVWQDASADLTDVRFLRNLGEDGGAILNEGTLVFRGGSIGTAEGIRDRWPDRNSTVDGIGGGIFNTGEATLTDVSIIGNLAHGSDGGGVFNGGEFTMERGLVYSNHAQDDGGGFYNTGPVQTLNLTNVTVSGNTADDHGGGLNNDGQVANLTNVTLAFNRADEDNDDVGDGGGIREAPDNLTVNLRNTIVAWNLDRTVEGPWHPDCSGVMTSMGNNLVQRTEGCTGLGGTDLTGADPMLAPLADNGGPTMTHELLPGSPAIDRSGPAPVNDQRTVPRPYGAFPDIGAYERFLCFKEAVNSVGTAGDDTIDERGEPPMDVILSLAGNDVVFAGPGKDFVCSGDGNDRLLLAGGRDKGNGQAGNDLLRGGGNPDLLRGGPGKDELRGGGTLRDKGDLCRGGPGKDTERGCEGHRNI